MSAAWLVLGVVSLLVSGALSILVTGAKMPFLREWVTDLELIRRCLVIHVNLATLVWFTAVPAGLTLRQVWQSPPRSLWIGFASSVLGIILMSAAGFFSGATPVLSNYVPVLTHPLHDWGLGLFFAGVAMNYLHPGALFLRSTDGPFHESRWGLWIGGAFFLAATAALVIAFPALERESFSDLKSYFEIGMWGGGHLLQHSSSVFLVVAWVYLLGSSGLRGGIFSDIKWIYFLLATPLTIIPFLFALSPWSNEYRIAFTNLMKWGIAPPILILIVGVIMNWMRSGAAPSPDGRLARVTWIFSAVLVCLGFLFGAFIEGPDLRVPGHYHATIGAVTIAFMLLSQRVLLPRNPSLMKAAIWCYGVGQILFASGMFTAGLFGVGRKVYGAEHSIANSGQSLGMAMLGIGGSVALLGGICFGVAMWRGWRHDPNHSDSAAL